VIIPTIKQMEPYVPSEQERRVVAMLSQEAPPVYNAANERMIVVPSTVQQPLARDFESLDPRLVGKSATVSACQQIQYLLRSDRFKVSALRYVTHLSAEPQNQQFLPLTPLMADLVECLREKNSLDELELTCWVIANLSSLEQNRDILRQAKVLPALVNLLNHYSERVHVRAMNAATNLLQNPKNKLLFRELSGVAALADRLANGSEKAKDAALRAVCIQGFDKGSMWQLLQSDVITSCVKLLTNSTNQQQRMAILVLVNLARDGTQNDSIREADGIRPLCSLLQSSTPFIQEKACSIICNLAVNEVNAEVIRDEGGLTALIELLDHKLDTIQLLSIWAIGNLLASEENQVLFTDLNGIQLLVRKLYTSSPEILKRTSWALLNLAQYDDFIRKEIGSAGAIDPLLKRLASGGPPEILIRIFKTVVQLSLTWENEAIFYDNGGVRLALNYITSQQPAELVELALMTLINLSKNDKIRIEIRLSNGIDHLVHLLYNPPSGEVQLHALKLFTNLAINGRNRYLLQSNTQLIRALQNLHASPVLVIRQQADMAIKNISFPCDDYDKQDVQPAQMNTAVAAMIKEQTEAAAKAEAKALEMAASREQEEEAPVAATAASAASGVSLATATVSTAALPGVVPTVIKKPLVKKPLAKKEILKMETDHTRERELVEEKLAEEARLEAEAARAAKAKAEAARKAAEQASKLKTSSVEQQKLEEVAKEAEEEAKIRDEEAEAKYLNRRANIAVELLVTERTYVEALDVMQKKYMNPMLSASKSKKAPINEETVLQVFSISEMLHTYHSMLLGGLERRISNWNAETKLGDYFLQMADFLLCYSTYVNNYDHAIELLTKAEENPAFVELLNKFTNSPIKGLNLYSYLIMPIQRIPRYVLLLQDLAKRTRDDHPDKESLLQACSKIEGIADAIDEKKQVYNDSQRVLEINSAMVGMPDGASIITQGRMLLREGKLMLNKDPYQFHCLLFNDALIVTKEHVESKRKSRRKSTLNPKPSVTYQFVREIALPRKQTKTKSYKDGPTIKNSFSLQIGSQKFLITTETSAEKVEWLNAIKKALSVTNIVPGK